MKQYPSIPTKPKGNCTAFWVFDKLDGSNIRVEWTSKRGFNKFGTRKRLLGSDQGILTRAEVLANTQEKTFRSIFTQNKIDKAICFFEFWGPNSFAGSHKENDDHKLTLIDVDVYKQGMIPPNRFLELFDPTPVNTPNFIHYGLVDEEFKNQVRKGEVNGVTFEGVVCKAYNKRKRNTEMFKIKSEAWIAAVKAKYGHNPNLLEQIL